MDKKEYSLREQAEQLYHSGVTSPAEISKQLGVSASTIRGWKSRHKWDSGNTANTKCSASQKNKCSATSKTGTKKLGKKLQKKVETNEELTEAQKAFCLHYVKNHNATSAYRFAHPDCSYSTAMVAGSKYLRNYKIVEEIKALKELRCEHLFLDGTDIVQRMMDIAFADITNYVEWGRTEVAITNQYGPVLVEDTETGEKVPLTKTVNEVRFVDSSEVNGALVAEVKQGKDGASVKLHDGFKALQWLADYFNLNPNDKHRKEYDAKRYLLDERKLELTKQKILGVYEMDNQEDDNTTIIDDVISDIDL